MNFEQYTKERIDLLNLGYKDYGNTNLYAYFNSEVEYKKNSGHINGVVYRCHLVEDWLNYYGLSNQYKKYIGVSSGVRDSLSVLSKIFNVDKINKWIIPKDVYPTYQKILNANECKYEEYITLGEEYIFNFLEDNNSQILLITNPLKPNGTMLNKEDFNNINLWLSKDKNRILIVDCAYMLSKIDNELFKLYETNQVILLFSLSKLWLIPNHFGVSLLPNNDIGLKIREAYKSLEKNQDKLNAAYAALNEYKEFPNNLKFKIIEKINQANKELESSFEVNEENPSYLFYDNNTYEYWKEKKVLTIPASVFGGDKGVIISILNNN